MTKRKMKCKSWYINLAKVDFPPFIECAIIFLQETTCQMKYYALNYQGMKDESSRLQNMLLIENTFRYFEYIYFFNAGQKAFLY